MNIILERRYFKTITMAYTIRFVGICTTTDENSKLFVEIIGCLLRMGLVLVGLPTEPTEIDKSD